MNNMGHILRVKEISKSFGGVKALLYISFDVNEGEIFSIIGPNGAGKTTLFNILTGVFRPDAGAILFKGKEINKLSTHKIASLGVQRTFQNLQVFMNMSVVENVMAGCHIRTSSNMLSACLRLPRVRKEEHSVRQWAMDALKIVGLKDYADKDASSLSYGMLKRLEIARSLSANPEILLLDEPAAGLNDTETLSMRSLIEEIASMGITVVLVEHNMELVMECSHRVMVLNYGESLTIGSPQEVQKDPQVISAYLGSE